MTDVSRETMLRTYFDLLQLWSSKINLISSTGTSDPWARHIDDSLQLVPLVKAQESRILDLGSGGGLPVIPLAISLPDRHVMAVESDQRKAEFLRTVRRQLALENLEIIAERSETLAPAGADLITARGFAPLPRLLHHALRHLKPDGRALLLKGKSLKDELKEATKEWRFSHDIHPSVTDPDAGILEIQGLHHA